MKIGIDVRRIYGQKTGVGVYIQNLTHYLTKIDNKNQYIYFYKNIESLKEKTRIFKFLVPFYVEIFHKQLILPFLIFFERISIFYCPNPPVPFLAPCPTVVTIHDIEVPPKDKFLDRFWFFLYHLTVRKAKKIIVVSLNTKKDVMNILHVPEEKIEVVYEGVDKKFQSIMNKQLLSSIQTKYGIDRKFILTVIGTFIPRKNIQRVIYAYYNLPQKIKLQYKLVLVGKKAGLVYHKVLKDIDNLGLTSNVIMTGYIPDEDLPLLYNAADLFVFLSLYEGFGLPPLEAMACGVPVVVSNSASLPEVVGDAAILVDPFNTEEITKAIYKVLSNESIKMELKKKGLERSKFFSWEKAAREILRVLKQV